MPQILSNLLEHLIFVFGIITLLGGVIAIHELGHFLFAKWSGIRVDTFSIGFGPRLWSKKWGETEYCLSLIPLGGFVKIYGQDPDELANDPDPKPDRAFVKKPLAQKVSVLFGGPLFNYLLSIFIFALLAVVGLQKLPPILSRVMPESPAYEAGLRSGDVVTSVDGLSTKTFEDVVDQIARSPGKSVKFSLLREGRSQELTVKVEKERALTPYGEESVAGVLEGLNPYIRDTSMATTLKSHPWGFQSGDRILEVDGQTVSSWEEMEKVIGRFLDGNASSLKFKVERKGETLSLESAEAPALARASGKDPEKFLDLAGIYNPELFIQQIMEKSPAAQAGLQAGDRLISANGKKLHGFNDLRTEIQQVGEKVAKEAGDSVKDGFYPDAVKIEVEREGKRLSLISPVNATKGKDPLGETIVTYTIGILSAGNVKEPEGMITERTFNPFKALWIGSTETVNHTVMTVVGLKKLAFGEVSAKSVGGPIMIGKLAGDTLTKRGWKDFLRIMAIISISLGVFNLIPIPILDGGHIVFAVLESLRGRPLSQQVQQMALKVGLSLILVLMVFALYNDITRVIPFSF